MLQKSWSADRRESGLIQTKSSKSAKPTQEYSSESWSRTVWSWRESKKFTQDQEQDYIYKQKDWADIQVQVRREVPERQECPPKFFGSEGKESWEDCSESTEPQRRSIELCITNFTLLPRVTNSRTRLFWLRLFSSKRPRRSMPKSLKPSKMPEDKRTKTGEEEELIRLKSSDSRPI